jgi:hypothetical protein
MNIKTKRLLIGVITALSSSSAYAMPLTLPPNYITYGSGPTGVSPMQLADDLQWLGQVVVASSTAIQKQQQADTIANGKQLTAQDNNLAANAKQANAATCQQRVAAEYPMATLNLPNGTTLTPLISSSCNTSGGNHMNAAGAMANSFLNKGAITNFAVNGSTGAPKPATVLGVANNKPGSLNYNLGNAYPTKSAAKQHLANTTNMAQLSAASSLMQFTNPGATKSTDAINLLKYIGITTNAAPSPQLSSQVQNTVNGKMYLASLREEAADLSISTAALTAVGGLNIPSAKVGSVIFTKNSSSFLGSLENAVNTLTNLTGITQNPSINQYLEATASSYFLSSNWYATVQSKGGTAAYYYPTSLYIKAAGLEMQYQTLRQTEYQTALLAQMYARQVRTAMSPKLDALRSQATSSQ